MTEFMLVRANTGLRWAIIDMAPRLPDKNPRPMMSSKTLPEAIQKITKLLVREQCPNAAPSKRARNPASCEKCCYEQQVTVQINQPAFDDRLFAQVTVREDGLPPMPAPCAQECLSSA